MSMRAWTKERVLFESADQRMADAFETAVKLAKVTDTPLILCCLKCALEQGFIDGENVFRVEKKKGKRHAL